MSYFRGSRNYVTRADEEGRVCTACEEYKEWSMFNRASKTSSGYQAICRQCVKSKKKPKNRKLETKQSSKRNKELKLKDTVEWKARRIRSSLLNRDRKVGGILNTPSKSEIKEWLSKQPLECYYSKEPITLAGCHVDHKKPLGRGGNNSLDNLCLTTPKANTEKGTMNEEEYRQLLELTSTWEDKGKQLFRRLRQGYYR